MNCKEIEKHIIDYLENSLEKEKIREFEKHLQSCEKCSDKIIQFKDLNKKLINQANIKSSQNFQDEFLINLENEKEKLRSRNNRISNFKSGLRIAAGILIFISGSFFGAFLSTNGTKLENEINELKQVIAYTALNEQTVSERVKAIYYLDELKSENQDMLDALTNALRNDENVNVRLAAAKALFNYGNNEEVRRSLVSSLLNQHEPMLQITLISYFIENNDKTAVETFKTLIQDENTNTIVKQYANKGIEILL